MPGRTAGLEFTVLHVLTLEMSEFMSHCYFIVVTAELGNGDTIEKPNLLLTAHTYVMPRKTVFDS